MKKQTFILLIAISFASVSKAQTIIKGSDGNTYWKEGNSIQKLDSNSARNIWFMENLQRKEDSTGYAFHKTRHTSIDSFMRAHHISPNEARKPFVKKGK